MTEKEQIWELAERIYVKKITGPQAGLIKASTLVTHCFHEAGEFVSQKTISLKKDKEKEKENG